MNKFPVRKRSFPVKETTTCCQCKPDYGFLSVLRFKNYNFEKMFDFYCCFCCYSLKRTINTTYLSWYKVTDSYFIFILNENNQV